MTRSYLLVVNPVSGRGRARRHAARLAERLTEVAEVEVVETRARGSASELTAQGASRADRVIAVGGDGTLNEVLCGLWSLGLSAEELPALGFLPSGTANAATRAFGFEADPEAAAAWLARAEERAVDVGVVRTEEGERPFLLWCGAGYDAVVIDALNSARTGFMGLSGLVLNAPRVIGKVAGYAEPPISLEVDGERWDGFGGVVLANVADVAFGGTLVGGADPFDGRLDLVAAPVGSKWRLPGLTAALFTKGLQASRAVRSRTARDVAMRAGGEVPVQVDGEPAGSLPVQVRVQPGAVRLLQPPRG